jgi:cytochrome c-type biogenesis protein
MLEIFIALGAGLISFLSPCVLPLIPGYISYISGTSLNELIEKKNINLIPIILFTIGFSIVFIIFGAASTFLGQVLLQNSNELRIGAGLVICILSLCGRRFGNP